MRLLKKIILIIATAFFTITALTLLAVCISILIQYRGMHMGNEAYGFYTAALIGTFLAAIPTLFLWHHIFKVKLFGKPSN